MTLFASLALGYMGLLLAGMFVVAHRATPVDKEETGDRRRSPSRTEIADV